MLNEDFKWTEFYMEFADKLLEYKDNRQVIIDKIYKVFDENGINLIALEKKDNKPIYPNDIDPFTVFGLFNRQISDENRIKIINGFKEEFSISADCPSAFAGIPVLNNLKSIFYWYEGGSGEDAKDNIWNLFEAAIKLADHGEEYPFIEAYDKVLNQVGIRWNITMALYWIRPFTFINLDAKNREFLSSDSVLSKDVANIVSRLNTPPKANEYLKLTKLCSEALKNNNFEYKSFPELSLHAYVYEKPTDVGIGDGDVHTVRYWTFAPGRQASMWDEFYNENIMAIGWDGTDDLKQYPKKEEIKEKLQELYGDTLSHRNDVHTLWQFANDVQIGDIIFAKRGMNEIIGRGIVKSDYSYDEQRDYFKHVRKVEWTHKGSWPYGNGSNKLHMKTLTDISDYKETVNIINEFFEDIPIDEPSSQYPEYSKEKFLNEVYISEDDYEIVKNLLLIKKNLILQGAPGVGKTFMAKRLAYSIMGVKDPDRVMMVQFHQSYSYEDFVMGYRPSREGFELREGTFYKFCKKAEIDDENDYFFIIDEINRGNLSKIFGELFMLIENDKRGQKNKIQLLYSDESFFIPKNVHIIGLMNTADRSLAMIDYALRRRFAFFDLKPGFNSNGFKHYQSNINSELFNSVIDTVGALNQKIKSDDGLGEGFRIGHSYFCNLNEEDIEEKLNYIIEYEIIPLIKEYWFDEQEKVNNWSARLREALR